MDIVRHAGALSVGNVSRPLGIEQPPSRPSSSGGPASSWFVALGATDGFSSSRVCIVPVSFFFSFSFFPLFSAAVFRFLHVICLGVKARSAQELDSMKLVYLR